MVYIVNIEDSHILIGATKYVDEELFFQLNEEYDKLNLLSEFVNRTEATYNYQNVVVVGVVHDNVTISLEEGKIAAFAWQKDYHDRVKKVCEEVKHELFLDDGLILVDTHSLNERYYAVKSGLGFLGKNGLVINEEYGSYFHIGLILTNRDVDYTDEVTNKCGSCKRCLQACPTNSITEFKNNGVSCISNLTQKKEYTIKQLKLLNGYVYGCDICQICCPFNQEKRVNTDEEYLGIELLNLSNKQFNKEIAEKTYSWRGANILKRNILMVHFNKYGNLASYKEDLQSKYLQTFIKKIGEEYNE